MDYESYKKSFPWIKKIRRKFLKSFPEITEETLSLLKENIHGEFEKLDWNDKLRLEAFYSTLNYFYLHLFMKTHLKEEPILKFVCVQLLYYLSYTGLILSDGDSESEWLSRILSALKSYTGSYYEVFDVLLLVRNVSKKYLSAYKEILRYILLDPSMQYPSDAENFLKIMLLFRRLKSLLKIDKEEIDDSCLTTEVECPLNLKMFISTLHINGLGQICKKNFIQKFLKKKLSPDILEKLFLALFKDKYDNRIVCCNFKNNKSKSSTTLSKKKVHSEETFTNSDPSSERKSKSEAKHLENSDSVIKADASSISQTILGPSHHEESSLQVLQNKKKKKKLQSQLEANMSEEHNVPAFNNSECNQSVSDTLEESYINSEIHSIETFKKSDLLSEKKSRSKTKNSSKSSDSLINSNVPSISENIFDKSHLDESSVQILPLKKKKKKSKSRLKENATVSEQHPVDSFNKSEFKQSSSETFKQSCINTKIQQEDNLRKSPSKTKISPEIDSTDIPSVSEDVLNKASIEESSSQILQFKKKKKKKSQLKEDATVSENVSKHHLVDVFNQSYSNQLVNQTFEQSCVNSGLSSERKSKCKTKYQENSDLIKADASSISINILEPSHLEESSSKVLQHKKKYQSQLKESESEEHPVHSSNKSECNQSVSETLEKSCMNSEIHSEENFNNSDHSSERKSKSKTKYLEKSDLIKADASSISQNILGPSLLEELSSQVPQRKKKKKKYQSQLKESESEEHPVHSSNKSECNQSANETLEKSCMNSEIHSEENFNNSDHSSERKSKSKRKYLEKSDLIKADASSISQNILGPSLLEESSSQVPQHKKKKKKYQSQLKESESEEHPVHSSNKSECNQSYNDTYEQSCMNSDINSEEIFKNSDPSSEKRSKSKTKSSDFLIKTDVLSIPDNTFDESSFQIPQSKKKKKKLKFHLNENVTVSKQHSINAFNISECNQPFSETFKQSYINTEIQPEDSFISSDLTSKTKIDLERSNSLIETDIPSVSENNFETGSLEKSGFQNLQSKKKKKKKSQVNKNATVSENVSEQHPVDGVCKSECEQSVKETLEQSCIDSDIHSEDPFINCDIPFERESKSKTKYSPKSSDSFLKADVLPNSESILDESHTKELNSHILQYGKEKKQVKSQLKETSMINDNVLEHCPVSNSDKSQFNETISETNEQFCISSEIHSLKDSVFSSNRKYLSETENSNSLIKSNVLSIPQISVGKSHSEETSFQEFGQVLPDSETTLCDRINELAERSATDLCQANNSVSSGSCCNSPVKIINSLSVKHSLLTIAENINSSNKYQFESQVHGEDKTSILLEGSNSDKSNCSADKSMNNFNFEFCKTPEKSLVVSLNKVQSSYDTTEAFIYQNSFSSPESLELCSPPPLLTSLEKSESKKCDSIYSSDSLSTLSVDSFDMASPVKHPVVTQKLSKDQNFAGHYGPITRSKTIASPDSPSKTQSVAKSPTKDENSTSLCCPLVSSDTSNITELNMLLNSKLTFSEHKSIAVPIKSSYSASEDITKAGVDSSSSVGALLNSELTNSKTRMQRYNFRSRRKSKKFVTCCCSDSDSHSVSKLKATNSNPSIKSLNTNSTSDIYSQNVSSNKLNEKESSSLQAKKFKSSSDSFSKPTNTKTKIRLKVSVNYFNSNVSTSDNLSQNAKSNENEKKCITESYEESFIESQLSDKETAPLIGGNTNLSDKSSDKTIALDSKDLFSNSNSFDVQNVANNEVEGIINDTSNLADKEICENSSDSSTFHSLVSESSQTASVIPGKNSNGEVCFDMSSHLRNQNSDDKFQTESTTIPYNIKELRIILHDCLAHQNSSAKLSLEQCQRNAKSQQKYKESTEMQTKAFEKSKYFSSKKNSADPNSTTKEIILSPPKLKNLSFNLEATTCDTKVLHGDKSVKQVQNSSLNADYFKKNSIVLEENLKLSMENFTSLANNSLLKQTSLEPYNLRSGENCFEINCSKAITYDFLSIQSVQESNLNNSKINSSMSDDYSSDVSCKNNLPGSTLQSPECSSNDFVISPKNVTPDLDTSVDLQFDKQSEKHTKNRNDYQQTVNAESFIQFSASEDGSNSNEASSDYASDISETELNDFIVPDNYESFDEDATSNDDHIHKISDSSECETASLKSSNIKRKLYNKPKSRKISATESDLSEDEESNKNDLKNLSNSDNKESCYGTASSHSQLFNGNSGSEFYNKPKCKSYSKPKSRKMSTTESDSSGDEKSNKRNLKFLSDSGNKDSSYGTASSNSQLSIGNDSSKFLCDNRPQNNFPFKEHLFESKNISSGQTSFVSGDCDQILTLQNISGDKTSTVSKNLLPVREVESYEQLESKNVVSKVSNDKIFPDNAHLMFGISDVNAIHSSNLISPKLKSQKSVSNLESDISCNQARSEISEKLLIDIHASKNCINELNNTENSEEQHALESNSGSSRHLHNNWSTRRVSNKSVLKECILYKTKKQPKFKNSSTSSAVSGFDSDSHSISECKIKTKEKLLGTSSDLFCYPSYSTTLLETQNKDNDSDCQGISNKKKSLINSGVGDLSRTNVVHFSTQNNSKVPARTENGGQVVIDTYVSKNSSNGLIHIENAEEQHALKSNSSNSKNLQTNMSAIVISNNSVLNKSVSHKTKKQPRLKNSSTDSSINVYDIVFFNPPYDTTLPETQNKVNDSECQDIPDKGKSLINFDVDDLSSRNVNPSTQNDGKAIDSSKNTSFRECEKFSESQTNENACASKTDVRNLQTLAIDCNEAEHFSDHNEKSESLSNEIILISKRALAEEEKTEENPPKKFKSITRDHLDTDESNKHINLDDIFGSLSDSFCKSSCTFIDPTEFDRSCNSCLFQIPTDNLLNTSKQNFSLFQDELNFDDVDPKLPTCTQKENIQVSTESENQKSVGNSDSSIQIKDLHLKRTLETSDNIQSVKFDDFDENLILQVLNNPTARLDQQLNEMGFEMLPECNNVSTVESLQPEVLNFELTSGEKNCAKMIAEEEKSAKEIINPSKADKRILFLYNEQKQSLEVCKIPDVSLLEILEKEGSQTLNSVDNPRKFSKKVENCDKLKNILNENFSCEFELVDGVKYSIASLSPVVNLGMRCDDVELKKNKLQTKLKVSPYKIPEGVICRRLKKQKSSTPHKKTDKCTRTIAAKNCNISRFQNNQTRNPEITSNTQHQTSSDGNSPKKCRAIFGLDQQSSWCKQCRRKQKCVRYTSGNDNADLEENIGSIGSEAATPDSRFDANTSHLSDEDCGNAKNGNNPKKCRALFGSDQQSSWCTQCRRKQKCVRYTSGNDNADLEENIGSVGSEAATPDSRFDANTSHLSNEDSGNAKSYHLRSRKKIICPACN